MTEEELREKLDNLNGITYTGIEAEETRASILAGFSELRAERDAALEGLKEKQDLLDFNATLNAKFVMQLARYREAVEYVTRADGAMRCPYCHGYYPNHQPNCLRQRALEVKP